MEFGLGSVFVKDVAVLSEEDEISLVVEGDNPTAHELRPLRKQRCQHPTHTVSQPRVEVVEDHLWNMARRIAVMIDLLVQHHIRYLKRRRRSVGKVADYKTV